MASVTRRAMRRSKTHMPISTKRGNYINANRRKKVGVGVPRGTSPNLWVRLRWRRVQEDKGGEEIDHRTPEMEHVTRGTSLLVWRAQKKNSLFKLGCRRRKTARAPGKWFKFLQKLKKKKKLPNKRRRTGGKRHKWLQKGKKKTPRSCGRDPVRGGREKSAARAQKGGSIFWLAGARRYDERLAGSVHREMSLLKGGGAHSRTKENFPEGGDEAHQVYSKAGLVSNTGGKGSRRRREMPEQH